MTNTKFRKRALLSSVAMLLVALVALGSATFAWFVDDPTADAKGLTASSQSSTGLQIKTDSSTNWSHHAKLACATSATGGAPLTGILLSPAILNKKDNKFYSVKAAAANAPAAKAGETWSSVDIHNHEGGNGVYHEVITLRKTGSATASEDVYLTKLELGTTGNMENAVVVILKNRATGTNYIFSKAARTNIPAMNKAITAGTTVYSDPDAADNMTSKAPVNGTSAATSEKIGTFAAGSNVEMVFDLYVYLDGAHSSVYSDNAVSASSIITSCNTYFALASNFNS